MGSLSMAVLSFLVAAIPPHGGLWSILDALLTLQGCGYLYASWKERHPA